jgi:hypothetical protein
MASQSSVNSVVLLYYATEFERLGRLTYCLVMPFAWWWFSFRLFKKVKVLFTFCFLVREIQVGNSSGLCMCKSLRTIKWACIATLGLWLGSHGSYYVCTSIPGPLAVAFRPLINSELRTISTDLNNSDRAWARGMAPKPQVRVLVP